MLERCPEAADERCLKCDVIDERDALVNELRDVRKDAASAIRDSARLREGIEAEIVALEARAATFAGHAEPAAACALDVTADNLRNLLAGKE